MPDLNKQIKKFGWVDVQFIKISAFVSALALAKLWPPLLSLDWYWYAIIAILAAIKPIAKALEK